MQLENVLDEDELHRRLAPHMVKRDGTVASVAFVKNGQPDNEISVDLARLTTTVATLASGPRFGIGALIARVPRRIGFAVVHDPLPDNEAHTVIRGESSKAKCRQLADQTRIVIHPG